MNFLPAQAAPQSQAVPPTKVATSVTAPVMPTPAGTFLTPPTAGDPLAIALAYLRAQPSAFGLTSADLSDVVVKDRYVSAHNGVTHLYLRQRYNGIEVFGGDLNINVTRDGRILNLGNRFVGGLAARVDSQNPSVGPIAAVQQTATALGLEVSETLVADTDVQGTAQAQLLSDGGLSADPIPVQLIYQPRPNGRVRLAWEIVLRLPARAEWLSVRTDAATGEVLSQVNWVSALQADQTVPPPNSYQVYGLPAESPLAGTRTLLTDPADPTASPFGWHDSDGVVGPEYTSTRGNNTAVYADLVAPDGYSDGDYATTTGGSSVFSYTADLNLHPNSYLDAALTNLFYVTNVVHDILYQHGFDEAAGNFQETNYTGMGQGNDGVNAEGQDYAGLMNANFATPPDGTKPRMQMYVGGSPSQLTVNTPAARSGVYATSTAGFGPPIFNLTGVVVLVNDGNATNNDSVTDGCQTPFSNAIMISGKIALIDRGGCPYKQKILAAQAAGAIGVIIGNDSDHRPTSMGDTPTLPTPVTIGSLLISKTLGDAIKSELARATVVNTTLRRESPTDGALDNGVIIHEYGHGLSNRLTGGPSNSNCLSTQESGGLGEGWSDFLALVLTAQPTDQAQTPLVVGRWLMGQPADGAGIRRFPYTTALNLNPQTFATTTVPDPNTGFAGEVHDVGEVWAAMLWEVYWQLVADHGFDPNLYGGLGGNNLALQLVIDGMKLQPCNPTFVEARDAILLADLVNYEGANACRIWAGFAKRGLGYSATAGLSNTVADGVAAFDLPPSCLLNLTPASQASCLPHEAQYTVTLGPAFSEQATLSVDQVPTNTVASFSHNPIDPLGQSTLTIGDTAAARPGWYQLTIRGAGAAQQTTANAALHLASAAPAVPVLTLPLADATAVAATPNFVWAATPQAISYALEVATDAAFTSVIYSATVARTSATLPVHLHTAQRYWWRVTAHNGCGSTVSAVAGFTVRAFPRVLLIDDDGRADAADVQSYYANALTALDIGYDQWDTIDGLAEPKKLEQLANYATVIWFTGATAGGPTAATETVLAEFLEEGRCLWLSAPEYYYDVGLVPFMQQYLGVADSKADLGDGQSWQTVITGTGGLFAGYGPYQLDFINGNFTDVMTPTAKAGVAFSGDAGNAALYQDGGHYRTSYWGFGLENLPTAQARVDVMRRLLDFCDFQTELALAQTVTPATALRPGQTVTYTISYSNRGVAPVTGSTITATLPAQLTDLAVDSSSPLLLSTRGQVWQWAVGELAPGATGMITVSGIISRALAVDVNLDFQAIISAAAYDSALSNNSASTTRNVVVPRVQLAAATLTSVEAAGVITVVATLDQVNPFGAVQADYQTSAGSAQAGSDYLATNGRLTIGAGLLTTTFTIAITDDLVIESAETLLITLHNPRGAAMGAPASGQITLLDNDDEQAPQPGTSMGEITTDPPPGTALRAGDQITYTVVVTNNRSSAERVTVTATLASNLRYVAGSANPLPSSGGVAEATASGEMLIWQAAAVNAGEQFRISFVAQVQATMEPIATGLTVAIGDEVVVHPPLVHNIQPVTRVVPSIFLPLIQR